MHFLIFDGTTGTVIVPDEKTVVIASSEAFAPDVTEQLEGGTDPRTLGKTHRPFAGQTPNPAAILDGTGSTEETGR